MRKEILPLVTRIPVVLQIPTAQTAESWWTRKLTRKVFKRWHEAYVKLKLRRRSVLRVSLPPLDKAVKQTSSMTTVILCASPAVGETRGPACPTLRNREERWANRSGSAAIAPAQDKEPSASAPTRGNKLTGLRNLGNTCFMNAVMQALMHIDGFREFFLHRVFTQFGQIPGLEDQDISTRDTLQCFREACVRGRKASDPTYRALWLELHTLFRVLNCGKWSIVAPYSMINTLWHFLPCFKGSSHQDAQEFLFFFLNRLETELQTPPADDGSGPPCDTTPGSAGEEHANTIRSLFEGAMISKVVCQKCKSLTQKKERFLDVSLQIPTQHHCTVGPRRSRRHVAPEPPAPVPTCSLEECFQSFARPELLPGTYFCDTCQECTSAWKELSFSVAPDILCVVLKRFAFHAETSRSLKVDTHVTFPLTGLTLRPWMHTPADGEEGLASNPATPPPRAPEDRPPPLCAGEWAFRPFHHRGQAPFPGLPSADEDSRPCKRQRPEPEGRPTPLEADGAPVPEDTEAGYVLRAIIVHHGQGLQTGHYTAYCWNDMTAQWIHFNDGELQRNVPLAEVRDSQAYILFYDRPG